MTRIENHSTDIIVAGAGPAGCTIAIGLRKLGYRVTLVHAPRPWQTCEGISMRTREGLRNAGLFEALACVPAASPRQVRWNGEASAANTEHLVLRKHFDAALLADCAAAGAQLMAGRMRQLQHTDQGLPRVHIDTSAGPPVVLQGRFFVEARGRAAPGTGTSQLRGPETVSLLQLRQGSPGTAASGVSSLGNGWAWLATTTDGLEFIQFTVTADDDRLPKRGDLDRWFEDQLGQLQPLPGLRLTGKPLAGVIARGSTSILQDGLVTATTLRAGDAAMAVDPLSGNGIFQALSSALIAPAVINTLLQYPQDSEQAVQLYQDRVRHAFLRFARMGRDFYRMETRWRSTPFWHQRQEWPDQQAAHAQAAPTLLGVHSRPVVAGDRICSKAVAITSDQPLGVWHVAGVELAPLLQDLPASPSRRRAALQARLLQSCAGNPDKQDLLAAWLRRYQQL